MKSQMSRLFYQSLILFRYVALSMFCLVSCSEQSQEIKDVDCNQVTDLFALDDWKTLATGPLVEWKMKNETAEAPAKSVITSFEDCTISRMQNPRNQNDEKLRYSCKAPVSTANGDNHLAAAKTVAAKWQACLSGWTEVQTRSVKMGDMGEMAIVMWMNRDDDAVSFSRSCVGLCYKGGVIALLFGGQREPVEVTISRANKK